jgi:hypothetical protein
MYSESATVYAFYAFYAWWIYFAQWSCPLSHSDWQARVRLTVSLVIEIGSFSVTTLTFKWTTKN